jgi:hydroxymethylglutaryl-CoA lyase
LTGLGGCPFAGDELIGNIPTEAILTTLAARGVSTGIDTKSLAIACAMTEELREKYVHVQKTVPPITSTTVN